jgi:hypothetical protein
VLPIFERIGPLDAVVSHRWGLYSIFCGSSKAAVYFLGVELELQPVDIKEVCSAAQKMGDVGYNPGISSPFLGYYI